MGAMHVNLEVCKTLNCMHEAERVLMTNGGGYDYLRTGPDADVDELDS